jgi:hypothetical protein
VKKTYLADNFFLEELTRQDAKVIINAKDLRNLYLLAQGLSGYDEEGVKITKDDILDIHIQIHQ